MPWWVAVYGMAISLACCLSVYWMGRAVRTQRKAIHAMHSALTTFDVCGIKHVGHPHARTNPNVAPTHGRGRQRRAAVG